MAGKHLGEQELPDDAWERIQRAVRRFEEALRLEHRTGCGRRQKRVEVASRRVVTTVIKEHQRIPDCGRQRRFELACDAHLRIGVGIARVYD
ncbi:MAG: hypothetical protein ABI614_12050, partial [Planctomycetota bacterium]